ncbi:MAG: SagB/ThcOx family dehydrogenase, partial [Dehalococcoidia bacterium]|nr:SagB/ThcOx family dehydrogenase [Dehalococcoidia bacterium]
GKLSLEQAISKRRSVRRFKAEPLTLEQLSQLLWSAQGITGTGGGRAAPSAGATYPLEVFIIIGENGTQGLAAGIYHYDAGNHTISLHQTGDFRQKLADTALGQSSIARCPVAMVICAIHPRTAYRYGRRGERYVHMEAGHVGQNVSLQAVTLGLGTVMVGAFEDEEVQKALKLEEQFKPLYIIPIGRPV